MYSIVLKQIKVTCEFQCVNCQVGVMAIIGVTEFKAEFGGMLDLHKRFGFNAVFQTP